jgi:hypothetical protein
MDQHRVATRINQFELIHGGFRSRDLQECLDCLTEWFIALVGRLISDHSSELAPIIGIKLESRSYLELFKVKVRLLDSFAGHYLTHSVKFCFHGHRGQRVHQKVDILLEDQVRDQIKKELTSDVPLATTLLLQAVELNDRLNYHINRIDQRRLHVGHLGHRQRLVLVNRLHKQVHIAVKENLFEVRDHRLDWMFFERQLFFYEENFFV